MTVRVCILDYGSGNVKSVYNLVSLIAENVIISNSVAVIQAATHIILPGVGAFEAAMSKIRNSLPLRMIEHEVFNSHKPFMGICVGLQVLADTGMEFGEHSGLGWIPGEVQRLNTTGLPLPHIGWNDIHIQHASPLFLDVRDHQDLYFAHSYIFKPVFEENILATTWYGEEFACVLGKDNLFGVQFHPEKSQKAGRLLIQNFLNIR